MPGGLGPLNVSALKDLSVQQLELLLLPPAEMQQHTRRVMYERDDRAIGLLLRRLHTRLGEPFVL